MRGGSIRGRLLLLLVGATAALWALALTLSYIEARRELNELFDAQLAESAKVLLTQSRGAMHEAGEHGDDDAFDEIVEHRYEQQMHAQIWTADGRLAYQSSRDLPPEPLVRGVTNGYVDRTLHGAEWRVLVLTDPESGVQIQLCQNYETRRGLAGGIARSMLVPLAAALPLLALLIWVGTGRGIQPLASLAADLEHRAPENLDPMNEQPLARELQPMVRSLNDLLRRLRERFDLERRFTADAAHELRTPLAALKTQAEVALGARNSEEREHALRQIIRGIDRTTHLVQQLLTLARVDRGALDEPSETIDLEELARDTTADMPAEEVRLIANGPAPVAGSRLLLTILLRNLIENAIRHGGGKATVEVRRHGVDSVLTVADGGPGLAPEERERVFARFYRSPGSDQRGSGLGLSIVQRIAELHGADVQLEAAGAQGLQVTVRFGDRQDRAGTRAPQSRSG